jgi:catechol-2,3-dioxygenase
MADSGYGIRPRGYRLPDLTHVGAVTLQVSDVERSFDFYSNFLGFALLERRGDTVRLGVADRPLIILKSGAREALRQRRLGSITLPSCYPTDPRLAACSSIWYATAYNPARPITWSARRST